MKKITEFTIDRKIWLRGEGPNVSKLLREDDKKMCCIGIYLNKCGISKRDLAGYTAPSELPVEASNVPNWLIDSNLYNTSKLAHELMKENDATDVREQVIAELFAQAGIKVKFVN